MIPALAVGGAAWIVLSAVGSAGYVAAVAGLKRLSRSLVQDVPDVGEDDAGWLDVWPTVEEAEQAVYDRLFAAIPEVAADLGRLA